jgi:hypothetical protein
MVSSPPRPTEETARDLFDRILSDDERALVEPVPESVLQAAVEEGARHAAAVEALADHSEIASTIRFL